MVSKKKLTLAISTLLINDKIRYNFGLGYQIQNHIPFSQETSILLSILNCSENVNPYVRKFIQKSAYLNHHQVINNTTFSCHARINFLKEERTLFGSQVKQKPFKNYKCFEDYFVKSDNFSIKAEGILHSFSIIMRLTLHI